MSLQLESWSSENAKGYIWHSKLRLLLKFVLSVVLFLYRGLQLRLCPFNITQGEGGEWLKRFSGTFDTDQWRLPLFLIVSILVLNIYEFYSKFTPKFFRKPLYFDGKSVIRNNLYAYYSKFALFWWWKSAHCAILPKLCHCELCAKQRKRREDDFSAIFIDVQYHCLNCGLFLDSDLVIAKNPTIVVPSYLKMTELTLYTTFLLMPTFLRTESIQCILPSVERLKELQEVYMKIVNKNFAKAVFKIFVI